MPAPKGNSFWKARSTHGRGTIFKDPKVLDAACDEFFEWCDNNPIQSTEFLGAKATKKLVPKVRAYTLKGLCIFLGVNSQYFTDFEKGLAEKKKNTKNKKFLETYEDFSVVITRVREIIYTQQYTNAAAGMLKENIIARALGLSDKSELNHAGQTTVRQVLVTPEEAKAIKEALEKDL